MEATLKIEIKKRFGTAKAKCRPLPEIQADLCRCSAVSLSRTFMISKLMRSTDLGRSFRRLNSSGAVTEAKSLWVDPYALRDAAQHANVATTNRYSRNRSDGANQIVPLRHKKTLDQK
ncbi:MAG: hypothetical protein RIG84_10410 [Roseovarius sp.]